MQLLDKKTLIYKFLSKKEQIIILKIEIIFFQLILLN